MQEFVGKLEGGETRPKVYWGAEEEGGTRRWESTLQIGLESGDDWYTERGVLRALSARLEHFLDKKLTIPRKERTLEFPSRNLSAALEFPALFELARG